MGSLIASPAVTYGNYAEKRWWRRRKAYPPRSSRFLRRCRNPPPPLSSLDPPWDFSSVCQDNRCVRKHHLPSRSPAESHRLRECRRFFLWRITIHSVHHHFPLLRQERYLPRMANGRLLLLDRLFVRREEEGGELLFAILRHQR